tara:strand:- start:38 stop:526 length:489 start_codon:yes stop_codon:yes gene_type:complete
MSDYDEHSLNSLNDEPLYVPPDDNYSIISDSTCASENHAFTNGGNKNSYTKPHDSGHHKVVNKEGKNKTKIEAYSTSFIPGTMIRDAITGHRYSQYRVGSNHEDLFFKVREVTGQFGKEPLLLYYDSPEQYERHMDHAVSNTIKQRWTDKFANAQSMVDFGH